MLRPGNAGANTVADHLVVTGEAITQLREEVASGHREGDTPDNQRAVSSMISGFEWRRTNSPWNSTQSEAFA